MDRDFILSEEIKIREREVEMLKILQRIHLSGVDVGFADEMLLSGPTRNPIKTHVDLERKPQASAASSEVATSEPLEPYEIIEPKLSDCELSEETMTIIRFRNMGIALPRAKSPSLKQILMTPSKATRTKEKTPLRIINNNVDTPSIFSNDGIGFVCTPDIFKLKKTPPRLQMPKMKQPMSGNIGGEKRSVEKKPPTQNVATKRENIAKTDLRYVDDYLQQLNSPVAPTISFKYDVKCSKNQGSRSKGENNRGDVSPLRPEPLMSAVHSMMMADDFSSPISPELTSCLDRCRFK